MKTEADKPAEKPADKPAAKVDEKPDAKPAGPETPPKPDEKKDAGAPGPAGKPTESAARTTKPPERPSEKPPEKPPEKPLGKPSQKPSGTSPVALIAAAIVGGIVSLAGAAGLQRLGVIDLAGGASDERISSLESELAATRTAAESLRGDLEKQIAALTTDTGNGEAAGAIQARIDAMQAEIDRISSANSGADLGPLEARLAELESVVGSGGSGREVALESLEARIAKLSETVDARGSAEDLVKPLDERLTALKGELEGRVSEIGSKADAAARQAAEAAAKAADASAKAAAAASSDAIAGAVETSNTAARKAEQAVAIAPVLAAESLQRAVEDGKPFAPALAAFRSLGVDDPALQTLEPYAEQGLPTIAGLRDEFAELEKGFTAKPAAGSEGEDGGTLDRLLKGALNVVEVRPVEPQPGDSVAATGSRIRGALADRDLETVLREWQSLPEPQQAASRAWADKLKAIIAAETFADSVRTSALTRLNTIQ